MRICMSVMTAFMNKNVPQLGLGLAALGRPGYININRGDHLPGRSVEDMRERAFDVLDAAWSQGIRYFDCARSYGKSEEFLALWLAARSIEPSEIIVGSKWGYRYTADWRIDVPPGISHEVKDHSLVHLESQSLESSQILGPYLRLYQIHSATLESGVLDDQAVLTKLASLREEHGWRLGLSLSGPAQATTLRKALASDVPFDAVQATYNCLEQSVEEALLEAKESGLKVIVKEAMANGRVLQIPQVLATAKEIGVSPDALSLAAVMAQPFEPMVLSGAVTQEQMKSNAEALEVVSRLNRGELSLSALMAATRMVPESYWAARSELKWN